MEHFNGVRLSSNSVRNAVWHALNEPICQYLRKRNPRCSTVYIDNSLGSLATESPCILSEKWGKNKKRKRCEVFGPMNTELNPISHLLTLLEAHHIVVVSRIRDTSFSKKK